MDAPYGHKTVFIEVSDVAKASVYTGFSSGSTSLSGMTYEQGRCALTAGFDGAVERAEAFISKIESELPELPQSGGFETVLSTHGARVHRGRWLSGHPRPCYRRTRTQNDVSPLKIIVGTFVSGGVRAEDYTRRSEAIIAFLMLVQRFRPVELCAAMEMTDKEGKYRAAVVRLESKPINLSQVGFVIGHVAYSRLWTIGWIDDFWKDVYPQVPPPRAPISERRTAIGLDEHDIYINSLVLGDELTNDPLAWIKRELARITVQNEESI